MLTGTATGVIGTFHAEYKHNNFDESLNLIVEQGHEIEKGGQVMVCVSRKLDIYDVEITGVAVYVNEFDVKLEI